MGAMKPWHWVVLVLVVLLLFGAGKLPSLARNLGKSMRIFKSEVEELRADDRRRDEDDEADYRDERPRRRDRDVDERDVVRTREYDVRDRRDREYDVRDRDEDLRDRSYEVRERETYREPARVREDDGYRRD
ncbi:Sec-independent protein translocase subunit TatA [Brachybacterium sp. EF45031]|uniref:Sec-independent protein translocase subunit TatA n=1 Tax=Brachybacterium sillae TaxID=2810536 RepID=UPI00217E349A|nr:Sec-independent protein translocase subunit TatA [Brachybacterium sillae]MCS6710665.1 Sec-independent protein translocase subunit TatA [Brachybacterium sillae]